MRLVVDAQLPRRLARWLGACDSDFVESYLISKRPPKLLLVATGNMVNEELMRIFEKNLAAIESALDGSAFVELGRNRLIVHE